MTTKFWLHRTLKPQSDRQDNHSAEIVYIREGRAGYHLPPDLFEKPVRIVLIQR